MYFSSVDYWTDLRSLFTRVSTVNTCFMHQRTFFCVAWPCSITFLVHVILWPDSVSFQKQKTAGISSFPLRLDCFPVSQMLVCLDVLYHSPTINGFVFSLTEPERGTNRARAHEAFWGKRFQKDLNASSFFSDSCLSFLVRLMPQLCQHQLLLKSRPRPSTSMPLGSFLISFSFHELKERHRESVLCMVTLTYNLAKLEMCQISWGESWRHLSWSSRMPKKTAIHIVRIIYIFLNMNNICCILLL